MKRVLVYNAGVFILLVVLSGLVYLNSLNNGFYFDDFQYIVENKYIRSLQNIPRFFIDIDTLSSVGSWHYRPLVLVSHAVNYSIGRLNPAGYHILSLAFHIGTAYLLFLILKTMLGGGFIPLASALIFAVHPFNSEVVNYITARSSVMSGFFYLLSFYCWVRFRGEETDVKRETLDVRSKNDSSPARLTSYVLPLTSNFYIASLLAFILAMLTKEVAITLPLLLFLYDLYFGKTSIKTILSYIPFVFTGIFVGFITRLIFFGGFNLVMWNKVEENFYFIIKVKVMARYFFDIVFPVRLSVQHIIHDVFNVYFFLSLI